MAAFDADVGGDAAHAAVVAFCADPFMEVPLHVAAASLLRHLRSDYEARLYFLLTGYSPEAVKRLQQSLDRTERTYTMKIIGEDDIHLPGGLPALCGSYANYYRLLLPDLVNEERLLYLDSDLVVKTDVSPLFEEDMGSHPAGFVIDGCVCWSLDHQFQTSIGRAPTGPAFNDGVILFNTPEWRRQQCSSAVWNFALKHGSALTSHEQSVLNALFADSCHRLRPEFNIQLTPWRKEDTPDAGIIHFVGSPKPWDIAARLALPYAGLWFDEARRAGIPFLRRTAAFNARSWMRALRIPGGYRRALGLRCSKLFGKA